MDLYLFISFRMRSVDVGEGKVLLVREDGQYYAVGAKCTHYAAPLAKGEVNYVYPAHTIR